MIGFFINVLFLVCLFVMLLNQLLYTLPRIYLKSRVVLDMISGSLINPLFRFFSGWVLFQQNFNAPILILLFVLGFQFGGYILYRLNSKELEKKLGMKNSFVLIPEKVLKILALIGGCIAVFAFILACLSRDFFPSLISLGVLPLHFLILIIASLLLTPVYYNSIRHPTKMNMQKMYSYIYIHYLAFIMGFIVLFYIF